MSDFSPWGDFGISEAQARRRRSQRTIANEQAAMLGQQRGQRNLLNIQKQYTEGFQPMVAQYGRRGLGGPNVQSGIRTRGLEKYAEQLQADLGSETSRMNDELRGIAQDETNAQQELEDYLADLRLQKAFAAMQSAMNIKQFAAY
jgi:hypothetical protein